MNPLLLAAGVAIAKRRAEKALNRAVLGAAAYVVLIICGVVAAGFLTAAGFLYSAQTYGAIAACVIAAGFYALAGILGFLIVLHMKSRRCRTVTSASTVAAAGVADAAASAAFPGGIASLGLLAVAGYLMARSMARK